MVVLLGTVQEPSVEVTTTVRSSADRVRARGWDPLARSSRRELSALLVRSSIYDDE